MDQRARDSEFTRRSGRRRQLVQYRLHGGVWSVRVAAKLVVPESGGRSRPVPAEAHPQPLASAHGEAERAAQDARLAEQARAISALEAELKAGRAREQERAGQDAKLAEQARTIHTLDAQLKASRAREQERAAQDAKLAEQARAISALEAQVQSCRACEQERAAQDVKLTEQARTISALEAQLRELRERPAPVAPGAQAPTVHGPSDVIISYIHYMGTTKRSQADEFIELRNLGATAADVSGWRVEAGAPNQAFVFPAGTRLLPGAHLRVYTDRQSNEPGSFSFGSKRALWNDDGDVGRLLDATQVEIARYGYGSKETRTIPGVLRAHGLSALTVVASPLQIGEQSAHGRIDFMTALERAIRCLLEEPWPGTAAESDPAAVVRRNREELNRRSLRLLHAGDLGEQERERLQKEWLFDLESSDGPAHLVIVHRSGSKPARQELIQPA